MNKEKKDIIVITGASAGVGRATARKFAAAGNKIGLIARGVKGLEAAKNDVESIGGEAIILPADVADYEEIENAAEKIENEFGPIDIWINNAMTTVFAPFKDISAGDFKRVTEVTYLGFKKAENFLNNKESLKNFYAVTFTAVLPLIIFLIVRNPVDILSAAGIIAAIHTPVVIFLILFVNKKLLIEELRPGKFITFIMIFSGIFFSVIGIVYLLDLTGIRL